jgi:PBP1b-binding outer membrane lipoprotein LpoB
MKPALLVALTAVLLGACSNQQRYDTAQNWQRNQCNHLADNDARSQCEARAKTSYDSYNDARNNATAR